MTTSTHYLHSSFVINICWVLQFSWFSSFLKMCVQLCFFFCTLCIKLGEWGQLDVNGNLCFHNHSHCSHEATLCSNLYLLIALIGEAHWDLFDSRFLEEIGALKYLTDCISEWFFCSLLDTLTFPQAWHNEGILNWLEIYGCASAQWVICCYWGGSPSIQKLEWR